MAFFRRMLGHDWPRNVREIQKVASRVAMALRIDGAIDDALIGHAPEAARQREPLRRNPPDADELVELLDRHDFIQNRLAKALGVSRTTLDKWMRDAGVRRPSELDREEITIALARSRGDVTATARALRVSKRGLRLRMTEVGIAATTQDGRDS
jgi:DNA-binding NtrC family response regulator